MLLDSLLIVLATCACSSMGAVIRERSTIAASTNSGFQMNAWFGLLFGLLGVGLLIGLAFACHACILCRRRANSDNATPVSVAKPELASMPSVFNLRPFILRTDVKESVTALDDVEKQEKMGQSLDGKTFDLTKGISVHRVVVTDASPMPALEPEMESSGMAGIGKGHSLGLVKTVGMGKRYRERTLQLNHHKRSYSSDSVCSLSSQLSTYQPRDMDSSVIIPVFLPVSKDGEVDASGDSAVQFVALPRPRPRPSLNRPATYHEQKRPVPSNVLRSQLHGHRRIRSSPDVALECNLPPGLPRGRRSHVAMDRNSKASLLNAGYRRSQLSSIEEKNCEGDVTESIESRHHALESVRRDYAISSTDVAEYMLSQKRNSRPRLSIQTTDLKILPPPYKK